MIAEAAGRCKDSIGQAVTVVVAGPPGRRGSRRGPDPCRCRARPAGGGARRQLAPPLRWAAPAHSQGDLGDASRSMPARDTSVSFAGREIPTPLRQGGSYLTYPYWHPRCSRYATRRSACHGRQDRRRDSAVDFAMRQDSVSRFLGLLQLQRRPARRDGVTLARWPGRLSAGQSTLQTLSSVQSWQSRHRQLTVLALCQPSLGDDPLVTHRSSL